MNYFLTSIEKAQGICKHKNISSPYTPTLTKQILLYCVRTLPSLLKSLLLSLVSSSPVDGADELIIPLITLTDIHGLPLRAGLFYFFPSSQLIVTTSLQLTEMCPGCHREQTLSYQLSQEFSKLTQALQHSYMKRLSLIWGPQTHFHMTFNCIIWKEWVGKWILYKLRFPLNPFSVDLELSLSLFQGGLTADLRRPQKMDLHMKRWTGKSHHSPRLILLKT